MAAKPTETSRELSVAVARALDLPISTKQSVELARSIRYISTTAAKNFLQQVALHKKAVPFLRFTKDLGHKAGMGPGRFPEKAARHFLKVVAAAEANAQVLGMDASRLKIIKIVANKASTPMSSGRRRQSTRRTHLEVVVRELGGAAKKKEESLKGKEREAVSGKQQETIQSLRSELAFQQEKKTAEPSSQELLQKAQAKAAELKRREQLQKETKDVENLVGELQRKGTLRGKTAKPRGST